MHHVLYGLVEGHRKRRELGRVLTAAPADLATVDVDLARLYEEGTRALVFDFDGVLAPHAALHPLEETGVTLKNALQVFGAKNVYILSNKPSSERLEYFREHFSDIIFVSDVRKKPYPDGLEKVISLGGYEPQQVTLLDDRLMTGGLACLAAGAKFTYISKPYTDFSRHPFKESFFSFLRFFEMTLARFAA